jgi:hypothetical protein
MRRIPAVALLAFLAGCSNAPVAGFLDCVAPSRAGSAGNRGPGPVVPNVGPAVTPTPPQPQPPSDTLPPPAEIFPPVGPRP